MPINWKDIEEGWQRAWKEAKIFEADPQPNKPKFFITVAYPYPNSPQHVGHGRTFTLADVYARFLRMRGYNTLFPMAFHYTGTPILAMSKRLAAGDEELKDDFTRIYKVPPKIVEEFIEPIKIADYFHEEIRQGMKEIGYSIDWRREFTTIDPLYNRFIEWQFRKLQSKGLITRGSHPVGWCPGCGSPMGQHDTRGDVEPEIGKVVIIKFRVGKDLLPAATLRPETIFGVTNIWLKPEAEYTRVRVDGESWIVSKACAEKLKLLGREVEANGTFSGRDFMGRYAKNPLAGDDVPILPAFFVDPNNATGVVMSVPGHSPHDYIALKELKEEPKELATLGIKTHVIEGIKPISIITTEGYSEIPTADEIERLGIKNQLDPRLEEASKEVYSHELHRGRMKENAKQYAGMTVSQARERIREDLIESGKADEMYELINRPVVCRCGAECIVKIFENQWFIDYGNDAWKKLAHECLDSMRIVPEELRSEFEYTIDWLKAKACARKSGLGTKLPWDSEWIIESLSDSVIYMSYYIISKYTNQNNISANQLNDRVFDYIFLGEGDPKSVGEETKLDPTVLKRMREEFLYFYPLDSRNSGRDLVPNHLTFFIFNHAAIFPRKLWPCQIVVNGSVLMEGKKMSKSFGNIIPLREAIKTYGADPFRIAVLATAELLQDADFSSTLARAVGERLERLHSSSLEIAKMRGEISEGSLTSIDRWLLSRLQHHVKAVTEAMDRLRVREAIHNVLYMLDQDIQWYTRRTSPDISRPERKRIIAKVLNDVLDVRLRLLAPFAPHLCEEIWHKIGHLDFVSTAPWPTYDEEKIDERAIEEEDLIKSLLDDTISIIQATKIAPKRICYYTCVDWKWRVYEGVLKLVKRGCMDRSTLIKDVMADPELKKVSKQASKFAQKVVGDIYKLPTENLKRRVAVGAIDEFEVLKTAQHFLKRELKVEINIYHEEDPYRYDPKNRSRLAEPYRPAIYIE